MLKVKICGLTRNEDALAADRLGADFLGVVLCRRSPRYVPPSKLTELFRNVRAKKVGVFVNPQLADVLNAVSVANLDAVQLHGNESAEFICELKSRLHNVELWLARTPAELSPDSLADMLVADAPKNAPGTICDWSAAGKIAKLRRILLAGGLNTSNLADAVQKVRPYGVDIASGIESAPGIKDQCKLNEIFNIIKEYK